MGMPMWKRLYEDFFMRSRLPIYRKMLEDAKQSGYRLIGVLDFYNTFCRKLDSDSDERFLILRHDIDTSPRVAAEMSTIERQIYGIGGGTYYLRQSTTSMSLVRKLLSDGREIGFHYETIANYEKNHKTKSNAALIQQLPRISKLFTEELNDFRQCTGVSSRSIASHGDFVNRKLHLTNLELLRGNQELRKENGIEVEAYDEDLVCHFDLRCADMNVDRFLDDFYEGLRSDKKRIMLLVHPRHWKVDIPANVVENYRRVSEGIHYWK